MTVYRVEFTSSDQREFNDCWRECEALSAATFMLERMPAYLLPARIVDKGTDEVVQERRPESSERALDALDALADRRNQRNREAGAHLASIGKADLS